ncbi:BMC domain-containing protein [Cytobacillus sp. FSL H8-0458]|uniref:BMC domain-containing protein n=1 Tax=Cytobacillus sp. FSL H8-0458 TaxID=2975346 RepID=UPI0030FA28FF
MARALGMIETRGLIGSIEAADAMLKAADVTLVKQEKVDAALVTVLVQGDVSAVQAAVDAGKEAAARVGELMSAHVIPHPDEDIKKALLDDRKPKEMKREAHLVKKAGSKKKQISAAEQDNREDQ